MNCLVLLFQKYLQFQFAGRVGQEPMRRAEITSIMCTKSKRDSTSEPTDVEEVLENLGGFGKFQFLILFLILCMEIPCAFLMFVPVFIGVTPTEWLCDNKTISRTEVCLCTGLLSPIDPDATIVTEWGLICGSSWVSDTISSLQMSGMLVGNIYISQLSDWYGRRYCFLGITLQMALGSILTAAAPNPWVYAVARFICGASFSGFLSLNAVYSMEFLTPRWRPVASAVGPFGEAIMLLGLLAYLIRPWRSLVWATCVPYIGLIFVFPLLPESPRWLLRNDKMEEAYHVLARMARMNGREPIDADTLRIIADKERPVSDKNSEKVHIQRFSYLQFCRGNLRKTTLCLQGIWFSWGLVYFGISYNIKNLPGDPYLNVAFLGLMDCIAYPMSFFVSSKFGRRKSLVIFMTLTAISLVAIAILELSVEKSVHTGTLVAVLCFLGKYGTAGARSSARTLTGESYPTAIRVMGIGFAGMTAGIGAALAPQLVYLGEYWPSVPFFGFAVISVVGSLVSFLLAETNGLPLQEEVKAEPIEVKLD